MHGIIFAELKKFVDTKLGGGAWNALLADAGLSGRMYMPVDHYPDEEALGLVQAASKKTGAPIPALLESFGVFITPDLMKMYGHLAKPEWKTLDFIEHAENSIHSVVRVKNKGAMPPALMVKRISKNEIVIEYRSQRRMCALAKGIAQGVADHYKERIVITEAKCMHNGHAYCEIKVVAAAGKVTTAAAPSGR